MINEVALHNDYQFLVEQTTEQSDSKNPCTIEAIFIPFRKHNGNVNELLRLLTFYKGTIYLMPSDEEDMNHLSWDNCLKVIPLLINDRPFLSFFNSLLTTNNKYYRHITWDLPLKRNYALYFSRANNYSKILLIDDDIRHIDMDVLNVGSKCLYKYVLSGCFVNDFPDLSVICHLEKLAGENIIPFLSGSFLFINTYSAYSFFPKIYNEDWLFMMPHIINKSICSFGSIKQLPYDPFENPYKAEFQEFGDIIAEGLYALLSTNRYEVRFKKEIWEHIINERRETLLCLKNKFRDLKIQNVLESAIVTNKNISHKDCINFLSDLEKDQYTWNSFVKEIS
ncbi:MAG: hypothetical protein ABIJ30_01210 [bacterium]|nr:hypothetical protein [Patescibacteria group bacterium]